MGNVKSISKDDVDLLKQRENIINERINNIINAFNSYNFDVNIPKIDDKGNINDFQNMINKIYDEIVDLENKLTKNITTNHNEYNETINNTILQSINGHNHLVDIIEIQQKNIDALLLDNVQLKTDVKDLQNMFRMMLESMAHQRERYENALKLKNLKL